MLLYTIGAGITAAAGTRLALQLFIDGEFKIVSFLNISCQYLTETASGNLRACCHFNAPSPVSSPNSPSLVSYQMTLPPNDTDELHANTAMLIKSYTSS